MPLPTASPVSPSSPFPYLNREQDYIRDVAIKLANVLNDEFVATFRSCSLTSKSSNAITAKENCVPTGALPLPAAAMNAVPLIQQTSSCVDKKRPRAVEEVRVLKDVVYPLATRRRITQL